MKGKLIALLAIIVGFGLTFGNTLQAGQRPFHFSRDDDSSKHRVTVEEGNRMIDEIYRQFDAQYGVIKIAGYAALMMRAEFDSVSTSTDMKIDTFTCIDSRGVAIKFNPDYTREIFSSTVGRWINGTRILGGGFGYARFLTDSTFEAGSRTSNTWDTIAVLIIGRQK